MDYQLDMALYNGIFAVPNAIVDDYLKIASGNTLKVLLTLLRHSGQPVALSTLQESTGLSEHEVYDALAFWSDLEIINIGTSSAICETTIATEKQESTAPIEIPQKKVSASTPTFPDVSLRPTQTPPEQVTAAKATPKFQVISNSFPRPTVSEATKYIDSSDELKFLVNHYRETFGKDPDAFALCSLVSLFLWCEMPAESLALLISYYHSIGQQNWKTIERKIIQCKEQGIDTYEKTEEYIQHQSASYKHENEVRRIFGLQNRELTTREKGYIHQWYDEFHYTETLITLAFERSADSTGKLSFPYIHKILETWSEKKIFSVEEAQSEMLKGKPKTAPTSTSKGAQKNAPRKYTETSYDIDELEQRLIYGNSLFEEE